MSEKIHLTSIIPPEAAGKRLDQALSDLFPEYSRARIQRWIKNGEVLVDDQQLRSKDKVQGDEAIVIRTTIEAESSWEAQAIPLCVIYEDESLLVINKPAGLVVHPAAGNPNNTLLNALLHHAPALALLPRAGIIHRLDKDTTGIMVIAKTITAHTALVHALQQRHIKRYYQAIVTGQMTAGGTVAEPIGRHPMQRLKMAVLHDGKYAVTHYRILAKFRQFTHLRCQLETGRTHQIRVHLAHIRYPIVGDQVYGGRLQLPKGCTPELATFLQQFRRQALHAEQLELQHPVTGETLSLLAPLPTDMLTLLQLLTRDTKEAS